jgi:BirA family biotin operon repressor/biotin-[acetyl-CoA-carboxylase] ligase
VIRDAGGVGHDLREAAQRIAERGIALGHPLHVLAATPSTNDEAHHGAKRGAPHGAAWLAEHQTEGRGRRGRAWLCPAGEGLLFSVLLRVDCAPQRLPLLALLAGLAVRDGVAEVAPSAPLAIKWPNDVWSGGRKLAGVLVEAITVGSRVDAVIVGIGINVHTRLFPDEIADRATSVALAAEGVGVDRATLLAAVLASFDRDMHVVLARGLGLVRARLEAADALRGKRVQSDSGEAGVASGIDDDGRLLVQRDDGVLARWTAGEVHITL